MQDFQAYANRFDTMDRPEPQASWASGAAAAFSDSWENGALSYARSAYQYDATLEGTYWNFEGDRVVYDEAAASPMVKNADAVALAKSAGVEVDLGEADYPQDTLQFMIDQTTHRKERQEVMASAETGFATQLTMGLASGVVDPLNLAAMFVPVAPAGMLARVAIAETVAAKAGARLAVGAVEGLAGTAMLEPIGMLARGRNGEDFSMTQVLGNLAFGTLFGAAVHPVAGLGVDLWKSRLNGLKDNPDPPALEDVIARQPEEVQAEAMHRAAQDLIEGNPVSASEVINKAAAEHPELAKQLLVSASLRRDGPEIDNVPDRQAYWVTRLQNNAIRRVKSEDQVAEDAYTKRMRDEAGVKPRTNYAIAARKIAAYEAEILGAERVVADPAPVSPEMKAYEPPLTQPSALPPTIHGDANKLNAARNNLDALYPKMGEQKLYYLSALFGRQMADLEMSPTATRKELNAQIKSGKVEAFDGEGRPIKNLPVRYFDIDTRDFQADVLLRFKDPTPGPNLPIPPRRTDDSPPVASSPKKASKGAKLGPLSPDELKAMGLFNDKRETDTAPIKTPEKDPLSPVDRADLDREKAFIDEVLAREVSEIDTFAACLLGEVEE